ncbi:MAG TPA: plasmid mobilization relaxosome protein MobC [Puia sp.]|uniref:plasmid mobilization protein n=1 Tax=Puia sp. TaxID=2045100 RepID=UPI002C781331|nr:plasmid mobilization relaxosome protein MobC [Puia sp.]HVU97762.1 plasmid mobilization relaxosome protein MobC [Puia sp.]
MGRKKAREQVELKHKLCTRVNDQKMRELQAILEKNPKMDMSALVRGILHNRKIKIYVKDETLDNVMEELARLRTEIRAIGVNINQITRHFNTYPTPQQKLLYAKMAFREYQAVQPKIDELLTIISKLSIKWLSN